MGRERDQDGGREARAHAASGCVDNVEEVIYFVFERQQLEGVKREGNVGHQDSLGMGHSDREVLSN